jgi:pantetheine-phosphate adenylyltransferase
MYTLVAIGGTFERLHSGHRFFLSRAFELSDRVIIGLTSDDFVQKKFQIPNSKFQIQVRPYQERERELREFLGENGWLERIEIVPIEDVYGPALIRRDIEAIFVTRHSRPGAENINARRNAADMTPLEIIEVNLQAAQDHKTISSTRIRMGEIDRWGHVLSKLDIYGKQISPSLRKKLKDPQGELIRGTKENLQLVVPHLKEIITTVQPTIIITIGDEVTKLANDLQLAQVLSIIDFKVERQSKYKTFQELGFGFSDGDAPSDFTIQTVRNTAGIISKRLVMAIRRAIKMHFTQGKRHIIKVIGEDDLAGIPAILLAPLGSIVLYGQPGEGIVVVIIDEEKKHHLETLVAKKHFSS